MGPANKGAISRDADGAPPDACRETKVRFSLGFAIGEKIPSLGPGTLYCSSLRNWAPS